MIYGVIVSVSMLFYLAFEFGLLVVDQNVLLFLVYLLIINLAFGLCTGSSKNFLEIFKLTFKKDKRTPLSKVDLMKMNKYLILTNIIFGIIGTLLVMISMVKYMNDPSSTGPFICIILSFILITLSVIGLIYLPQRFILSSIVEDQGKE